MPPAGEATLEVDGKRFVFLASESPSARLFTCSVSQEAITANFQTDENDLLFRAGKQATGDWLGNLTARPRGVDGAYGSNSRLDGGAFRVEGKAFVYTGEFHFAPTSSPANTRSVGSGRVAVSCP